MTTANHRVVKGKVIIILAKNLKEKYNIDDNNIASTVASMLDGFVNQSTVLKYMPKEFKKWKEKEACQVCGKRVSTRSNRMALHMRSKHENQKVEETVR